jgi:hypothetical protein
MGEVDQINRTIAHELKALIPGASVTMTATACAAMDTPDCVDKNGGLG